jgi:acetyl-CoA carboxylase biotin carboxyl carrier protein
MNLVQIQDLIKFVSKSGVSEVEIEQKDFKITIKTHEPEKKGKSHDLVQVAMPAAVAAPVAIPVQPATTAPAAVPASSTSPAPATSDDSRYVAVKSPMIGTFYRSAGPDKPAFVEVGSDVKAGSTVCIIEAMKLFNEIESEVTGRIVKVLVNDNSPVEFDQPLFLVDPA